MEGIIIKSTGSWYQILDLQGNKYNCRLRGKFKLEGFKVTNPLAVGDKIDFVVEDVAEKTGIITDIIQRENYIIRKSPHKTDHGHIIASNIDQAILVATLIYPRTSLGFIDRFLVSAEAYRIPAVILFNKSDLYDVEIMEFYQELRELYDNLGYKTALISAALEEGLSDVKLLIQDKTSLLTGHSGVGKSTLLNALVPDGIQKVAEVSDFAQKGTHTTTFAEMFVVNENSYLIDTPGIKEWGLIDIEEEELSHFFPELRSLMGKCKFYNCTHTHEPGCAIMEAFNNGSVAASRYESYLSMLAGDDNRR